MRISRAIRAGAALAVLGAALLCVSPTAGAADLSYHCHSALGQSDTEYTLTADAPASVYPGQTFNLTNVVVTGTPPIDLLLSRVTFGLSVPAGGTLISDANYTYAGPGATDPPGPIAKAGIPNSSPPMHWIVNVTGAVGETVDIYPAEMSSTVVAPFDLSIHLDVSCTQTVPTPFLRIPIVAPPTADVLATSAAQPAAAVDAEAAFTG